MNARAGPPSPTAPLVGMELAQRTASAVLLAACALGTAYTGGLAFMVLWAAAGAAISLEWAVVTRLDPRLSVQALGSAGVFLSGIAAGLGESMLFLGLLALSAGAVAVMARTPHQRLWAVAGVAYAGVIAVAPVLIRDDPSFGLAAVLWIFAVVWSTDVAAYLTGRSLGGPKLWPGISPKKTWSGFAGGVVAGAAGGYATLALLRVEVPVAAVLLASAAASVAAQLGDLAESALKRYFGVKDASSLIPGHGGLMDRLDGFWVVVLLVGAGLALRSSLEP